MFVTLTVIKRCGKCHLARFRNSAEKVALAEGEESVFEIPGGEWTSGEYKRLKARAIAEANAWQIPELDFEVAVHDVVSISPLQRQSSPLKPRQQ